MGPGRLRTCSEKATSTAIRRGRSRGSAGLAWRRRRPAWRQDGHRWQRQGGQYRQPARRRRYREWAHRQRRPRAEGQRCRQERGPERRWRARPNIVAKEVRARMGAIKGCYERALKRNPTSAASWSFTGPSRRPALFRESTWRTTASGIGGRQLYQGPGGPLALPGASRGRRRGVFSLRFPGIELIPEGDHTARREVLGRESVDTT